MDFGRMQRYSVYEKEKKAGVEGGFIYVIVYESGYIQFDPYLFR